MTNAVEQIVELRAQLNTGDLTDLESVQAMTKLAELYEAILSTNGQKPM